MSSGQNVENIKIRKKFSTVSNVENVENRAFNSPIFAAFFDILGSFPHFPHPLWWKTQFEAVIVQFAQCYQKTEEICRAARRFLPFLFVFLSNFVGFFCPLLSVEIRICSKIFHRFFKSPLVLLPPRDPSRRIPIVSFLSIAKNPDGDACSRMTARGHAHSRMIRGDRTHHENSFKLL